MAIGTFFVSLQKKFFFLNGPAFNPPPAPAISGGTFLWLPLRLQFESNRKFKKQRIILVYQTTQIKYNIERLLEV